jgi:hypothetical protein
MEKFLMVFTDYKKASDSVKREEIWKGLEKKGNFSRPFEKVNNMREL